MKVISLNFKNIDEENVIFSIPIICKNESTSIGIFKLAFFNIENFILFLDSMQEIDGNIYTYSIIDDNRFIILPNYVEEDIKISFNEYGEYMCLDNFSPFQYAHGFLAEYCHFLCKEFPGSLENLTIGHAWYITRGN